MKKTIYSFTLFIFLLMDGVSNAQQVYKLWEGQEKPYYKENNLQEYEKVETWGTAVFNITEPTLTVYQAEGENTNKAVIILPGGGYEVVAMYHEGYDIAKLLAKSGITAAVLKYRVPLMESSDQPNLVPLSDARRALKLLREKAEIYGINKEKVGVMGFSAGSHLATVTGLWKSKEKLENPNFSALIYGITDIDKGNLQLLENNLYHRKLTDQEVVQNKLLDLVAEDTPPAFLVHAYNDPGLKIEEATLYAQKLHENKVPVEMHLFSKGGHGFGIGRKNDGTYLWVPLFVNWLKSTIE